MYYFDNPCLCHLKLFESVPCFFAKWPRTSAGHPAGSFSLAYCVPPVQHPPSEEWCRLSWGTPQDVITDHGIRHNMQAEFCFEADTSPPFRAFEALSKLYPTLRIGLLADQPHLDCATMTMWADGQRLDQISTPSPTAVVETVRRAGRSDLLKRHEEHSKTLYSAYYSAFPEWSGPIR